jgi:hypothetical protein
MAEFRSAQPYELLPGSVGSACTPASARGERGDTEKSADARRPDRSELTPEEYAFALQSIALADC